MRQREGKGQLTRERGLNLSRWLLSWQLKWVLFSAALSLPPPENQALVFHAGCHRAGISCQHGKCRLRKPLLLQRKHSEAFFAELGYLLLESSSMSQAHPLEQLSDVFDVDHCGPQVPSEQWLQRAHHHIFLPPHPLPLPPRLYFQIRALHPSFTMDAGWHCFAVQRPPLLYREVQRINYPSIPCSLWKDSEELPLQAVREKAWFVVEAGKNPILQLDHFWSCKTTVSTPWGRSCCLLSKTATLSGSKVLGKACAVMCRYFWLVCAKKAPFEVTRVLQCNNKVKLEKRNYILWIIELYF